MSSSRNRADEATYVRDDDGGNTLDPSALATALQAKPPPLAHFISGDIPNTFGARWAHKIIGIKEDLIEDYGDTLEDLLLLAYRVHIYVEALESAEVAASGVTPCPVCMQGPADSLYYWLSETSKPEAILDGTPFENLPRTVDILKGISLIWFFHASLILASDHEKAMNTLLEISEALSIVHGLYMWEGSVENSTEEARDASLKKALALNKVRHEKNHEARAMAIEEWEKNPSKYPSAEKAGRAIADWLRSKGHNFEPRTVTGWIRSHAKQKGVRFR